MLDAGHDALGSAFRSDATTFLGPSSDGPVSHRSHARLLPKASCSADESELGYGLPLPQNHRPGTDSPACIPSYGLYRTVGTATRSSLPPLHHPGTLSLFLRTRLFPGQHTPLMGSAPSSPNVLPMSPVYLLPMYPVCTLSQSSPSGGRRGKTSAPRSASQWAGIIGREPHPQPPLRRTERGQERRD